MAKKRLPTVDLELRQAIVLPTDPARYQQATPEPLSPAVGSFYFSLLLIFRVPRPNVPCTQLVAPEDIEGGADRRCTDVLFMVVLLLGWLAMTYLGFDGIANGDPHLLVNGIDYDGRICGIDDAVKDKPKV